VYRRLFVGVLMANQTEEQGDLSRVIEDAVRWRVFRRTVRDIKARNTNIEPDELQRVVGEAVREVRAKRRIKA
jgi:hypothetical protein